MSKTFKHINQRKLKTKIIQEKQRLGIKTSTKLGLTLDCFGENEILKLTNEFWRGPLRHGNERHSIAKNKVLKRRVTRKKIKHETNLSCKIDS